LEGKAGDFGQRQRMRLGRFRTSRTEQFKGPGTSDGEDGSVGVDRQSGDGRRCVGAGEDEGQGQDRKQV
jgi:hypothetical protein